MRMSTATRRRMRGQEGYALVLVVFMMALVVIATAAIAPNIITNGRREKEEEMIWRGKQYVRGIRLFVRYYQTHGGTTRFPTSMEDLTKNKVGIRFMRQAYKDPVNSVDGSWRMIYVGPNGQLIGSLKVRPLSPDGQTPSSSGSSGGFGSLFGAGQGQSGNNSTFGNSSFGNSTSGNSSFGNSSVNSGGNTNAGNTQGQGAGQVTQSGLSSDTMSTPQAIVNSDGSTDMVGGNIIGVGSKVNKASIIWYDKAKNYRQFEFIWDPSKEPINGGAAAGVIGVPPAGAQNGQNGIFGNQGGNGGFGQQPPSGITGNPNPGTGNNPPPGQTPPGQTPQ
jgi:type II secretory pathway pseudopilin PulG